MRKAGVAVVKVMVRTTRRRAWSLIVHARRVHISSLGAGEGMVWCKKGSGIGVLLSCDTHHLFFRVATSTSESNLVVLSSHCSCKLIGRFATVGDPDGDAKYGSKHALHSKTWE
jgi:hypothetical protein